MKYLLILAAFLQVTCEKTDAPNDEMVRLSGIPDCLKAKIEELKKGPPSAEIYSYTYKDQTVYYISMPCCDFPNLLLDVDCNVICSPDGGFSGGGNNRCVDFHSAKNKRLIWKDDR